MEEEEEQKKDVPRIFTLVESPDRGKEFGVQRAFVEMITPMSREGLSVGQRQPAYDIDQSVSFSYRLTLIIIAFSTLFNGHREKILCPYSTR